MTSAPRSAVALLQKATTVVEIGIGDRTDLASALADAGVDVVATDLRDCDVPEGVTFIRDDVTDPRMEVYAGADLVYARRLPGELQVPSRDVAIGVGADLYFTTLGFEWPEIPVETVRTIDGTWYLSGDDGVSAR